MEFFCYTLEYDLAALKRVVIELCSVYAKAVVNR
jgi:hypothetical protein